MDVLDQETLRKNEIDANKALAKGSIVLAFLLIIIWIAYLVGLFQANTRTMLSVNVSFPIFIILLGLTMVYYRTKLIEKPGFKYFLLFQFIAVIIVINILLPKHGIIVWAAPVVLAAHYYNPKVLFITYIISAVFMILALYISMFYGEWDDNLMNASRFITLNGRDIPVNSTTFEERVEWLKILRESGDNRYLKVFLYYYLPRLLSVTFIGSIAFFLTQRSARLLKDEAYQVALNTRIGAELDMARNIQSSVLPRGLSSDLEKDVAALMDPAKEVGGDFYDYFKIDETHLALVIADVSGKGVPGALFMMKAETLIKSLTSSLKSDTANIMARSNVALCSNNNAEMFVTCWLGIVDLVSGELRFTNAGHNAPIIVRDGKVEYLEAKHGVVLGALENSYYTENIIQLNNGDRIILYTDGVTEAHNKNNELYGENRLLEFTKNNINEEPLEYISKLRGEVQLFSEGYEQFDDITMLVFEYHQGANIMETRVFKANVKELNNLFEYSSSLLKILDFSKRDIIMINTALEEVFVNVANYAYEEEGTVEVSLSNNKNKVTFVFKDHGREFNPLEREDPNITAKSEEREIGGLGIYMVKNIMDEVTYKYENGENVLTLVKYRK